MEGRGTEGAKRLSIAEVFRGKIKTKDLYSNVTTTKELYLRTNDGKKTNSRKLGS